MIQGTAAVESVAGAYQPDILLPAQQPRRRATTPEEALIVAVLEDAIDCVRKHRGTRSRRGRALFQDAENWFVLEQPEWPFSFERICACLELDPDGVRRALGLERAAGYRGNTLAAGPTVERDHKERIR